MTVTLKTAAAFIALICGAGCETDAQRKAAENVAIVKQGAAEIKRICALPEPERDAELKKMKAQSGIVLECGAK